MKVQVTFKGNASEMTDYGTYSESGGSMSFQLPEVVAAPFYRNDQRQQDHGQQPVRWHSVRDRRGPIGEHTSGRALATGMPHRRIQAESKPLDAELPNQVARHRASVTVILSPF